MRIRHIRLLIAVAAILATANLARAQEYAFGSALSQSVAGVVSLLPPSPSIMQTHPALMSFASNQTSVELSYRQLYGLDELDDFAGQARHRLNRISGGVALSRFGQAGLYQEYTVVGSGSYLLLPNIAFGTSIQYSSEEYGEGQSRYSGAELALSGAFQPIKSILFSGAIRRLTLDRTYDDLKTDPVYEASIAWSSPSEVALGAIWTRERQGDHRFALGQILHLTQNFDFLGGLRFDPVQYSLGGRASYHDLSLVYSYEGHPDLGSTHSFGFLWSR